MDILEAIDAATGCQQCGNPLGASPSSDFCSEFCQGAWHANRVTVPRLADLLTMSPRTVLRGSPVHFSGPASIYRSDGESWIRVREASGFVEYRAHFEVQEDGSVVDNTEFIRERQRNANATLRTWTGEGWWAP